MSGGDVNKYETLVYGEDSETQFIRYYKSSSEKRTVFAIIHGGYWKKKYSVDTAGIDSLVPFLLSRGYGVCLIEYRRVGHDGGGWPGTNNDVVKALEKLDNILSTENHSTGSSEAGDKVVILGHSAGGTLALWAACKLREISSTLQIALCAAVAPVGDLVEGYNRKLSDEGDAISLYMGCDPSASVSDDDETVCPYRLASPHFQLPLKVPTLLAIGTADADVPPDMVVTFHKAAIEANLKCEMAKKCGIESGPPVSEPAILMIPYSDHYQVMNAAENAWLILFNAIELALQQQ